MKSYEVRGKKHTFSMSQCLSAGSLRMDLGKNICHIAAERAAKSRPFSPPF